MKIAFTVQGKTWEDKMDPRFGRAAGFLLFDEETREITWHENSQNIHAAHGAGIQAGQSMVNLGAEALITGHVGPKAFNVLNAAGIKIYTNAGELTVKEAYEKFKSCELPVTEGATTVGLG